MTQERIRGGMNIKTPMLLAILTFFYISSGLVAAQENNFSIILFPDTQKEVKYDPGMWESMPSWVVENREAFNIQAVIGLGDVTDDCTFSEFSEAQKGWNVIKDAGIIYVPVPGNHDLCGFGSHWNNYFGVDYFSGKKWFGSANENSTTAYYVKFDVGSKKYLIIALGYDPSNSDLLWAEDIIKANEDREVIIATHSFINGWSLTGEGINIWRSLWDNKDIILVVCGHTTDYSTSSLATTNGLGGNKVYGLRVDYQDVNYGGGYMTILRFQNGEILVSNYSAYLNNTDVASERTIAV